MDYVAPVLGAQSISCKRNSDNAVSLYVVTKLTGGVYYYKTGWEMPQYRYDGEPMSITMRYDFPNAMVGLTLPQPSLVLRGVNTGEAHSIALPAITVPTC